MCVRERGRERETRDRESKPAGGLRAREPDISGHFWIHIERFGSQRVRGVSAVERFGTEILSGRVFMINTRAQWQLLHTPGSYQLL